MSLTTEACWDATVYLQDLQSGAMPPGGAGRRPSNHLLSCVDCQLLLAVTIVEWEREHTIPPPPQSIGRWRPLALHLWSSGEDAGDSGCLPDLDARVQRWRLDAMQLEDVAGRAAWSLDGDQEGRIQRWLAEIEALARASGGLSGEDTDTEDIAVTARRRDPRG
jgi:hypothetical protein